MCSPLGIKELRFARTELVRLHCDNKASVVSWKSKKWPSLTRSCLEMEPHAVAYGICGLSLYQRIEIYKKWSYDFTL